MRSIVCLCLALLIVQNLGLPEATCRFRCDYTFFKEAGGYLKYHEIPATWEDARLRCTLEGSVLASPLTPEIKKAMFNLISPAAANCSQAVWTGINSMFSKGDYSSVEAYQLDKRTGKCYKFHTVPRIWSRAYLTCKAEGGHLAIPNSEVEDQILKDLFNKGPMPNNAPDADKSITFIGFYDWDMNGEWRTIHGQTLQEAGFEMWEPGQPSGKQYCGGMFKSGKFDDSYCNVRATFICEKDPETLMCEESRK